MSVAVVDQFLSLANALAFAMSLTVDLLPDPSDKARIARHINSILTNEEAFCEFAKQKLGNPKSLAIVTDAILKYSHAPHEAAPETPSSFGSIADSIKVLEESKIQYNCDIQGLEDRSLQDLTALYLIWQSYNK